MLPISSWKYLVKVVTSCNKVFKVCKVNQFPRINFQYIMKISFYKSQRVKKIKHQKINVTSSAFLLPRNNATHCNTENFSTYRSHCLRYGLRQIWKKHGRSFHRKRKHQGSFKSAITVAGWTPCLLNVSSSRVDFKLEQNVYTIIRRVADLTNVWISWTFHRPILYLFS